MTVSPFCLARYPVKCQVEVQILMSMENGVNIGLFLHRLVQNTFRVKNGGFCHRFWLSGVTAISRGRN